MERIDNFERKQKEEEVLKKIILNDYYIQWLNQFIDNYGNFDDIYFVHEYNYLLCENDLVMINYLQYLHKELNKFAIKNNISNASIFSYAISYNDKIYIIEFNGEGYSCNKYEGSKEKITCIEYNDFRKSCEKNMQTNFQLIKERVIDSLNNTDLEYIRNELSKLNEPTIFSGVGGSSVVSEFGSKVINKKNEIVSVNVEPRDMLYQNSNAFKNVIACSYSGNNYGVELSFLKGLKKYLLSNNSFIDDEVTYLQYKTTTPKEKSFISLGATLIPISILMDYYLNGQVDTMIDCIKETKFDFNTDNNIYEIFSGYDTSSASKFLESTMIEAGIGVPIVHDKYSYCHGRSTLAINYHSTAIYFDRKTEFDKVMMGELNKYYNNVVVIESKNDDQILDDYQMLVQSMYLTKYIAEKQNKDLSKVGYSPIVKKLYKYNGNI